MLLIRAILLWSIISLHVVGGAAVFRLLFPKESAWLGFVVPSLALVVVMNFIEHLVAVPTLLWLLPFTTLGSIWCLLHPKLNWKGLHLPMGIFLGSFAFTLFLRALKPTIIGVSDGIPDLGVMSSFLMGEKVPPPLSWDPDLPLSRYYALLHYAMSVLTRLLGLDIGTGFNLSSALVSAFDCFTAAAVAWRIGRQKLWITLLAPVLIEGASTGATAYQWFAGPNLDPRQPDDFFNGFDVPENQNLLYKLIHDVVCRHKLVPPGAWSWDGSAHATCGGLFLVLFLIWVMAEVLRRQATNWPWICLGVIPLLTIVTSAWAIPLVALLLLGTIFWIWYLKLYPRNLRFVLLSVGFATALMEPVLAEFLTTGSNSDIHWTGQDCRIQPAEYLILWWPIYLPLVALLFIWPRLSPAIKTVMVCLPLALIGIDLITVTNRDDWIGKLWCYTYGAGWIALVPAVFIQRAIFFRLVTAIIIASSLFSFAAWAGFLWRVNYWEHGDALHLEGTGSFRWDPVLSTILEDLSRLHRKTILTGKTDTGRSPVLAAFTGNRIYIAWWSDIGAVKAGSPAPDIAKQRGQEVNDFYKGKCEDPLLFLRTRDISAVVIFPEDKIDTSVVDNLKKNLAPYYEYIDCHGDNVNAGIFFYHSEMLKWPAALILHPPNLNSPH
jgi:Uncharacterized membrane protein (DUF2298)